MLCYCYCISSSCNGDLGTGLLLMVGNVPDVFVLLRRRMEHKEGNLIFRYKFNCKLVVLSTLCCLLVSWQYFCFLLSKSNHIKVNEAVHVILLLYRIKKEGEICFAPNKTNLKMQNIFCSPLIANFRKRTTLIGTICVYWTFWSNLFTVSRKVLLT